MNKVFLDSNILIYLYSEDEQHKKKLAHKLISEHTNIFISTQVLFECTHIAHKKLKFGYSKIETALQEFNNAFSLAILNYNTFKIALRIATNYKYSFVDSLIIAAALENQCNILFSEDMHFGQQIENSLKIINPFIDANMIHDLH